MCKFCHRMLLLQRLCVSFAIGCYSYNLPLSCNLPLSTCREKTLPVVNQRQQRGTKGSPRCNIPAKPRRGEKQFVLRPCALRQVCLAAMRVTTNGPVCLASYNVNVQFVLSCNGPVCLAANVRYDNGPDVIWTKRQKKRTKSASQILGAIK